MASIMPYDRYDRAVRRAAWPFDAFDDFFSTPFTALGNVVSGTGFQMDVEDAGNSYVVTAELPGVSKDQIDVELNEGNLTISVDKKESDEKKNKNYLHKESGEWKAARSIYLKDASTAGLSAKLDNGVLTVNVPKQQENTNATKISID